MSHFGRRAGSGGEWGRTPGGNDHFCSIADNIAADAFGNALGQGLVDAGTPRPSRFDIEDAEAGQAMKASAARAGAASGYTAVGGDIFDQVAQAFGEERSQVVYGDKYAKDADRMDVMPAFRDLTVDRRTGKPSFAYSSWLDSDAEQALFGSSLIDGSTERNGSRRSFYISEGGAAFGSPGLGSATGDPHALVRANARLEAGVAASRIPRSPVAILRSTSVLSSFREASKAGRDSLHRALCSVKPLALSLQRLSEPRRYSGGRLGPSLGQMKSLWDLLSAGAVTAAPKN
jgi:hypothetical protein